jgi:hypothetical protein
MTQRLPIESRTRDGKSVQIANELGEKPIPEQLYLGKEMDFARHRYPHDQRVKVRAMIRGDDQLSPERDISFPFDSKTEDKRK